MNEKHLAIEQLVAECKQHHATGAYHSSLRCIKEALRLMEESHADAQQRCRVLLEAARSAYYCAHFSESERLLDEFDALLTYKGAKDETTFTFESAIIRANVYRRIGKFKEAIDLLKAHNIYRIPGCSPSLITERFLIEGACFFYLNRTTDAEEKLEIALGLATQHADSRLRSRILTMLGFLARSKGFLGKAEDYFSRALAICKTDSDLYGEATIELNMSIIRYRQGWFDLATKNANRAKTLFGKVGWHLGVCRSLLALGNVMKYQRKYDGALRIYDEADKVAQDKGFIRERALATEFEGEIHAEQGNYRVAEVCYEQSLKLAESIAPEGDIVVEVHRRLCDLYLAEDNQRAVLPLLERSLPLAQKLGEQLEEALILRSIGTRSFIVGSRVEAKSNYQKAIEILRCSGCRFELAKTDLYFAEHLLRQVEGREFDSAILAGIEADALNKAWDCLIEASHIFKDAKVPFWEKRTGELIKRVAALRLRTGSISIQGGNSRDVIQVKLSSDLFLYNGFAALSDAMSDVWERVKLAARISKPVLITGETGTGKELIANLLHAIGDRCRHAFVAVNCAAVPDHLFESEFFGHKKGCFTGATTDRRGIFQAANGGTLFLDEIGELSQQQQVKLLRVLQEGKVRRVGENDEYAVNVRIISATNQDLKERIREKTLREDFLFRINSEHIHIPPLRERPEDIIPLVVFYLSGNGRGGGKSIRIETPALKCLQSYPWPGNVRELFSVLEHVKHKYEGDVIVREMLPEHIGGSFINKGDRETLKERDANSSKEKLVRVLTLCGGNKSEAAKLLGISRATLYKELRRSGLGSYIRDR